ncbi:progonadoliberin-1-like [Cololabis saira]|uniref:progonadoliberin-1-like n=1 Tax=Cololabis saira TaxID=129043 RepID=UPI002AD370F2|nr:progonadoliberin-1-like [Cololabis saira]
MAVKMWTLMLLLGAVLPQGCCQHWSFGLSPGGKRELDGFPGTLDSVVEGFPHRDATCSVLSRAEEPPFAKVYRVKALPGSVTNRKNGYQTHKK